MAKIRKQNEEMANRSIVIQYVDIKKIKNGKQNVEAGIHVKLHVHICNIRVTEMCYDALFIFHEFIFLIQELVLFFFFALVELIVFFFMQFNARSESVKEKVSFRRLIQKNRCLVAVEGYEIMVDFEFCNFYLWHARSSIFCV